MDFVPDLHGEPIYLSIPQADYPPDRDDIRWAEWDLVPALDEAAQSLETQERVDLGPLAAARDGLDDSEWPAWADLVRRVEVRAARDLELLMRDCPAGVARPESAKGVDHSTAFADAGRATQVLRFAGWSGAAAKECALMGVVAAINEEWCVPRRLLLYRSNLPYGRDGPTLLWRRVAVHVAAVRTAAAARFAGGEINTYLVSSYQFERGGGAVFDPLTRSAVLHFPYLVHDALECELVAQGNEAFVQYRQMENPLSVTGTAYVPYGTGRWRAYRDIRRLVQALVDRAYAEEVRHGVDRHRVRVAATRAGDTHLNYVSNGLLIPQSRLCELLQRRAGAAGEEPGFLQFLDTWVEPGSAVTERACLAR